MPLSSWAAERFASTLVPDGVYFTLLRREKRLRPRFDTLWAGWGWRLSHFLEFDNWGQLLHPTVEVSVDVPVGQTVKSTPVLNGHKLVFDPVEMGKPPSGSYHLVQMTDHGGREIATMELLSPKRVREGENFTVTSITISFS